MAAATGAAVGGISAATNLTTQGISAAERAAEDTARNLADAADRTLNAAAGAADSTASSFNGSSSRRNRATGSSGYSNPGPRQGTGVPGYSGSTSGSESEAFDSVNVRVPGGMAWANAAPARGTMR